MEEITELRATIDRMLQEQVKVSQHVTSIIEQMKALNDKVNRLQLAGSGGIYSPRVEELNKRTAGPGNNRE